jgi:hypothetical protein
MLPHTKNNIIIYVISIFNVDQLFDNQIIWWLLGGLGFEIAWKTVLKHTFIKDMYIPSIFVSDCSI